MVGEGPDVGRGVGPALRVSTGSDKGSSDDPVVNRVSRNSMTVRSDARIAGRPTSIVYQLQDLLAKLFGLLFADPVDLKQLREIPRALTAQIVDRRIVQDDERGDFAFLCNF